MDVVKLAGASCDEIAPGFKLRIFLTCHKTGSVNPFPPSPNERLHWAVKAKLNALWRKRVVLEVGARKRPRVPLKKASLQLIRHSSRKMDPDNWIASMKPVIDGLRDAMVLADDRDIVLSTYWVPTKPKFGGIEIIVEEIK